MSSIPNPPCSEVPPDKMVPGQYALEPCSGCNEEVPLRPGEEREEDAEVPVQRRAGCRQIDHHARKKGTTRFVWKCQIRDAQERQRVASRKAHRKAKRDDG